MKRPWKNFAVICAHCERAGNGVLLKPLEYAPAYKTFTVSHGSCRYHELLMLTQANAATISERAEYRRLRITRTWQGLVYIFKAVWNA